ncbi:MAG: hypothetical protein MI922_06315, partial [Bacteroidales bacterium]|nr:hypothetical protein [Bacteroidales bacterium]
MLMLLCVGGVCEYSYADVEYQPFIGITGLDSIDQVYGVIVGKESSRPITPKYSTSIHYNNPYHANDEELAGFMLLGDPEDWDRAIWEDWVYRNGQWVKVTCSEVKDTFKLDDGGMWLKWWKDGPGEMNYGAYKPDDCVGDLTVYCKAYDYNPHVTYETGTWFTGEESQTFSFSGLTVFRVGVTLNDLSTAIWEDDPVLNNNSNMVAKVDYSPDDLNVRVQSGGSDNTPGGNFGGQGSNSVSGEFSKEVSWS